MARPGGVPPVSVLVHRVSGWGAMSVGGFLRVLRAAVFAAVCVVLAALGHVLMSGEGLDRKSVV